MANRELLIGGIVVLLVVSVGYLVYSSCMTPSMPVMMAPAMAATMMNNKAPRKMVEGFQDQVVAGPPVEDTEMPQPLVNAGPAPGPMMSTLPSECYPKEVLTSADLLPQDANSLYAQVAPSGQGSLQDQNFLTAGFHIGINTVGQTLRNANRQLRSEPPNPQVVVSPWLQTTIEPDLNRRPLEIDCGSA